MAVFVFICCFKMAVFVFISVVRFSHVIGPMVFASSVKKRERKTKNIKILILCCILKVNDSPDFKKCPADLSAYVHHVLIVKYHRLKLDRHKVKKIYKNNFQVPNHVLISDYLI